MFLLILEREEGRQREKHQREKHRLVASIHALTGDHTHNLGVCPDQGWNPQPSVVWGGTPNAEPPSQSEILILTCGHSFSLTAPPLHLSCCCVFDRSFFILIRIHHSKWIINIFVKLQFRGVLGGRGQRLALGHMNSILKNMPRDSPGVKCVCFWACSMSAGIW